MPPTFFKLNKTKKNITKDIHPTNANNAFKSKLDKIVCRVCNKSLLQQNYKRHITENHKGENPVFHGLKNKVLIKFGVINVLIVDCYAKFLLQPIRYRFSVIIVIVKQQGKITCPLKLKVNAEGLGLDWLVGRLVVGWVGWFI